MITTEMPQVSDLEEYTKKTSKPKAPKAPVPPRYQTKAKEQRIKPEVDKLRKKVRFMKR